MARGDPLYPLSAPLPPQVSSTQDNLRPSALQFGSEMDVLQAGGDNQVYKDTWNGSSWGGFSGMSGDTPNNPASVQYGPEMDLFIRGGDGQIYTNTCNANFWRGWHSLGGNVVGAPAAGANGSGLYVLS